MPFCKDCGTELPEVAKFCFICGAKIESLDDEFSLGEPKAINPELLDEIYSTLVSKKPSYMSSYDDYYKTTADVFKIVGLNLFQTPDDSDLAKISNWCADVSALAEKLWLRTNQEKLNSIKDALGSLFAFFKYYSKKKNGDLLYSFLFDKLKILIDDKTRDNNLDSLEHESILLSAKDLGLYDEKTPERKEILVRDIEKYCETKGSNISLKPEDSESEVEDEEEIKKLTEFAFVEGNGRIKDFYIAKYAVTQKIYADTMGNNPSVSKDDFKPVETVSWYEAVEFCNKFSEKNGRTPCYRIDGKNTHCDKNASGYRLPTEEEWEYAARGGKNPDPFKYAGSDNIDEVAWHKANSAHVSHKVGMKKPNKLGLFDMSGNVWEWAWDSAFSGARYFCGGCWEDDESSCKIGSDDCAPAEETSRFRGFRLISAKPS